MSFIKHCTCNYWREPSRTDVSLILLLFYP